MVGFIIRCSSIFLVIWIFFVVVLIIGFFAVIFSILDLSMLISSLFSSRRVIRIRFGVWLRCWILILTIWCLISNIAAAASVCWILFVRGFTILWCSLTVLLPCLIISLVSRLWIWGSFSSFLSISTIARCRTSSLLIVFRNYCFMILMIFPEGMN